VTVRGGDSYCGIYCGACDIRLAGETGKKSRLAEFWNEPTLLAFHKAQGLPAPSGDALKLRCDGCKSDEPFVNCRSCKLRACARGRNLEHCSACADFPCALYRGWRKVGSVLPHVELCSGNLQTIEAAGVERWLSEQEERWRCPECRARIGWYSERCATCGADVRALTLRFSSVKALFLRLAITLLRPLRGDAT
jgi:hypothetical protein